VGLWKGSGQPVWIRGMRDGGGGVQGQMECGYVGGDSEHLQFVGEQLLDGMYSQLSCACVREKEADAA